jgi:peptidoglycan/xylan/chitin deacetylase (PgdA/CDA1 family)
MARGALCISIDLELAWGCWDRPSAIMYRACAEKERAIVLALLDRFASREVPVTWAIVSRLLDASGGTPVSTEFGPRIWYAPDVVEAILNASPAHDVGSHGFAHLYFRETERERLQEDLQSAQLIHKQHGLPFTSFVFPRNQVAHLDLLAKAGVKVYRGVDAGWHSWTCDRFGKLAGRTANLLDKVLPIPPAVVTPSNGTHGLVVIPGSMLLLARNGLRRLVRPQIAEAKAKLGLRLAARQGRVFHLWFHPANFYWDTDTQLRVLERILDEACAIRERAEIDILTMASFSNA